MPEQVRVFVSHHHSSGENRFTARLVADLEAAGADVWVDTTGIPSGRFVAKISEGMAGRQWLVLVMTPAALASEWVRLEVETAIAEHTAGRMLGVVPFVMTPVSAADVPLLWRTLHRYDATHGYDAARDALFAALGLGAGRGGAASPPPRLAQPPTVAHSAPPDRFPPRLARLGYSVEFRGGAEVILPPLCAISAGPFLMGSDPAKDSET